MRPWPESLLLACLAASAAGQETPPIDPVAASRAALLAALNGERERLGLVPLRLVPELTTAAQAHVADMDAKGYVGFTSPDGKAIEAWVEEAGYRARLVTEKLATSGEPPPALAASWGREPERHAQSLFHPEVRDLGIGLGARHGLTLYALVLARSQGEALSDPAGARRELFDTINESRVAQGLHALGVHPALDRAAQAHAEALLSGADRASRVARRERLVRRVIAAGYQGPDLALDSVAETIVRDTLSAGATRQALLDSLQDRRSVLARGYTGLGIGLAVAPTKTGYRTVWVLCLARLRALAPGPTLVPPRVNPDGSVDPP
ncbi:MAG TPA: CAP domain-containing protein [Thermoanaerobaculia bacterium]|nr:CAP domain-containing protein [Thermoanaerobaculia bacterium]